MTRPSPDRPALSLRGCLGRPAPAVEGVGQHRVIRFGGRVRMVVMTADPFRGARRIVRRCLVGVGWLASVCAVVAGVVACSSAQGSTARHVVPVVPGASGPNNAFATSTVADPLVAPAASAVDAVQQYVAAEAAGDGGASWGLLADADRARVGSLAAWVDEAADRLPLRSIGLVTLDGSTVVTEATLHARLDEGGFVPGRARIEWHPVQAGGGWLVSLSATRVVPELPDDVDAAAVVQAWISVRQGGAGGGRVEGEYAGNLLGQPTLVQPAPTGTYRVGPMGGLASAPDGQVAVNAFGPEAVRFVRVVPLDGPVRLVVLVAPLDQVWKVVGVEAAC